MSLEPFLHGAEHEGGRRAGTESALLTTALGAACRLAADLSEMPRITALRDRFWTALQDRFGAGVVLNGHSDLRLPNMLNCSFIGAQGGEILAGLDGVAASAGSACHSAQTTPGAASPTPCCDSRSGWSTWKTWSRIFTKRSADPRQPIQQPHGDHHMSQRLNSAGPALAIALAAAAAAEEVTLTDRGLVLYANLETTGTDWQQGLVVLMTHGTLAHGGMEIMQTLQSVLQERGISSLSMTLSLGLDDRSGMYDCATPHTHLHTDAVGAWLGWLQSQGVEEVPLLGHSRGGNQSARFAAEHPDAPRDAAILIAPQTWSETAAVQDYEKRFVRRGAHDRMKIDPGSARRARDI
jgi:hypothetical protein